VVAAAVGGLTTIVDEGRTGLLVESRRPEDFAVALDAVLGSPEWAAELGASAAGKAAGYRWSTTAGRLRRVYADLAARTPIMC
jgi:D-inositol-3-phosphate glycosyltransferase